MENPILYIIIQSFWALLSAVMGFVIGRWYMLRDSEKLEEIKRISFLKTLEDTLKKNIKLGEDMRVFMEKGLIPTFRYDELPISIELSSNGYLFSEDIKYNSWQWNRYKMNHVNNHISSITKGKDGIALLDQCQAELIESLEELQKRSCSCVLQNV